MSRKKLKFDTINEPTDIVRDIGNRKKLTPHDLCSMQPLNDNQIRFIELYLTNVPLISMTGYAGTGKTFLALWMALQEVLDTSSKYDKIVVIRSAVETRQQGFLPGGQDEKDAPYEVPYIQACKDIFPRMNDGYTHLKSLGHLEFHTTGHFRGQNLSRSIIIIDEAQNTDWDELSTLITRCADHSRIIVLGDVKQCDLHRKRQKSGLNRLFKVINNMPYEMTGNVEFGLEDIVRSGLVKQFIIADYETPEE